MTALDRITRARIALLLDEPFFGALLMHLKPVRDDTCPTFSTDGRTLRVNEPFLASLGEPELRTVLAHEVMHCALLHPYRRGVRELRQFNVAADYAINNFLDHCNAEAKSTGRPPPFVFDGPLANACINHDYDGLSAEEIYARLIRPPSPSSGGSPKPQAQSPKSGQGQGQGTGQKPGASSPSPGGEGRGEGGQQPCSPGEFTDGAADEAGRDEGEADWKVAVQQAALGAKARGQLPVEAARFVDELLHPKVPWQEILRQFLTATAKDDYSWARPNRRYASGGCLLPGLHSPRLGKIIVAVDSSGSIGQKEFTEFLAEVQGILFNCRPEQFILAQCDAALHDWQELDLFADVAKVKFKGGGGTDFRPVFERVEEDAGQCGSHPAALVYLTDLDGTFPDAEPGYPVLWAATNTQQAPWGNTLNLG